MNEQSQPPVSQSPAQSPPPAQAQAVPSAEEPKEAPGSLGKFLLIGLGAVLLVAGTAGVTYWLMNTEGPTETEDVTVEDTDSDAEDGSIAEDTDIEEEEEVVDPYEGWETYTVDRYGISFEYPPTWTVSLEEGPADEGPDDWTDVLVENDDGYGMFRLYVCHYLGAIAYPESAQNIGSETIDGRTYYKYDCTDIDYNYLSGEEGSYEWLTRTPGSCFQFYYEPTTPVSTYLHNSGGNDSMGWYSLMYGSVDKEHDFMPTSQEMEDAHSIVKSIEGLH